LNVVLKYVVSGYEDNKKKKTNNRDSCIGQTYINCENTVVAKTIQMMAMTHL
jgi:hypothetical protein